MLPGLGGGVLLIVGDGDGGGRFLVGVVGASWLPRIRAEARGTTVYASATLPLGDIEGISASQHRRCSQETLQVFPLIGVHMAETYMLCPWPLC